MPRKEITTQASDLLSCHYRAIGPAAIMAALLCCPRERKLKAVKAV
jgi:hypothetical protein